MPMLESLGWRQSHQVSFDALNDATLAPARVATVSGPTLTLLGLDAADPLHGELVPVAANRAYAGALTVGDWVACKRRADTWAIEALLPRSSCFVRKASGRGSTAQLVAANVDRVFVVTAVGADLSLRRLERYLSAIWSSGAGPVIVINKVDRPHDADALARELSTVSAGAPVVRLSALYDEHLRELEPYLVPASTVAVVGSSGVGKSTLINRALGREALETRAVREHDDTGQHTTTRRELVLAPSGVWWIDTPGMRELGLIDAEGGLTIAFADLEELARHCRFSDCAHDREPGCAVQAAVASGLVPKARVDSYAALREELARNAERADAHATHNSKREWKAIHKSARDRRKLHHKLGLKDG